MPRNLPRYRLHRPSGRAVVTLTDAVTGRRRDVYLGEHGTPESRAEYDRVVGDWLAGGRVVERPARHARREARPDPTAPPTVAAVLRGYYRQVMRRYNGQATSHTGNIRAALRFARSLYGSIPAAEFGPRALADVRDQMAEKGWKRGTVNARIGFIVAAFKSAVAAELVESPQWQALTAVPKLRRGEAGVAEGERVRPVPIPHVEAVKPHVAPQVAALIDLQLLTGARGGELLIMRAADLTTGGKVWEYRPATHKGQHRGHERVVYLGPRAQAVVQPFMAGRPVDAYLFDPGEGNAARKAEGAGKGQHRRPDQPPTPTNTERRIGERYSPASYRRAISRACDAAGVPHWTPHQLRHTAATELRREFGLEAASLVLGHGSAEITDGVYAERDAQKVRDVLSKIG